MVKLLTLLGMLALLNVPTFGKVKNVDLRRIEEPSTYYIGFVGRSGLVGHAFVLFGIEDAATRSSSYKAFGFYPLDYQAGSSGSGPDLPNLTHAFGVVPGIIVNEVKQKSLDNATDMLLVRVNAEAYQKANDELGAW